jgi:hypothetical protein
MPRILPDVPTTTQAAGVILGTGLFFLFGLWALSGVPLVGLNVRVSATSLALVI